MPNQPERKRGATESAETDTRGATFGGAAGALVAVIAFVSTAVVIAFGTVPGWTFIPISFGVFAAFGRLIVRVFPRRQPTARQFSRWFLIVGTTVLAFLLGHCILQWW